MPVKVRMAKAKAKAATGDGGSKKATDDNRNISLALCRVFETCQEDSTPVTKSVKRFRQVWDSCHNSDDESVLKRSFFKLFVHYLRAPLAFKERTSYVERCLEVACRFAASFLKQKEAEQEEETKASGKAGEGKKDTTPDANVTSVEEPQEDEEPEELPEFMHWLFDWLLDHHEVEASQARLRICLMINHLLRLMGE